MIKNSKFSAKNIIYSLFSGNFKPQVTYKGIPLLTTYKQNRHSDKENDCYI